jgi:hypothetical protein
MWKNLWITFENPVKKSKFFLLPKSGFFCMQCNPLFINHYQENAQFRVQRSVAGAYSRACRGYPQIQVK